MSGHDRVRETRRQTYMNLLDCQLGLRDKN